MASLVMTSQTGAFIHDDPLGGDPRNASVITTTTMMMMMMILDETATAVVAAGHNQAASHAVLDYIVPAVLHCTPDPMLTNNLQVYITCKKTWLKRSHLRKS